jgi:hypothetical protein
VLWHGGERSYPMMDKADLAGALIELIAERYRAASDATRPQAALKH